MTKTKDQMNAVIAGGQTGFTHRLARAIVALMALAIAVGVVVLIVVLVISALGH